MAAEIEKLTQQKQGIFISLGCQTTFFFFELHDSTAKAKPGSLFLLLRVTLNVVWRPAAGSLKPLSHEYFH